MKKDNRFTKWLKKGKEKQWFRSSIQLDSKWTDSSMDEGEDKSAAAVIRHFTPLIVMIVCFLAATILTIRVLNMASQDRHAAGLMVEFEPETEQTIQDGEIPDEDTPAGTDTAGIRVSYSYDSLSKQAPEASAYINIEGTGISYPVMWSETDGYYLTHASDGTRNRNGAIFLSHLNSLDFSDPINYIFGHNMKSGMMFRGLNNYLKKEGYLESHKDCYIVNSEGTRHYTLFFAESVPSDFTMKVFNDACIGQDIYTDYIRTLSQRTGTYIADDARLVVLITCTTGKNSNRTIVYGYLD